MGHLRQEAEPEDVGLDPKALARLDQHFAHEVGDGRLPAFSWPSPGTAARPTSPRTGIATSGPGFRSRPTLVADVLDDQAGHLGRRADPHGGGPLRAGHARRRRPPAFARPRVYVGGSGAAVRTRPAEGPILVRHLLTHTAGLTFGFYTRTPSTPCTGRRASRRRWYPARPWRRRARCTRDCRFSSNRARSGTTPWRRTCSGGSSRWCRAGAWTTSCRTDLRPARHDGRRPVRHRGTDTAARGAVRRDRGRWHRTDPGTALRGRPRFLSGSGGMVATAHDYHRFMEFLRRGGELDGVRLLSSETVATMTSNHLPGDADMLTYGSRGHRDPGKAGLGFGLGVSVVTEPELTRSPRHSARSAGAGWPPRPSGWTLATI